MTELAAALAALRAETGVGFAEVRRLLCHLAGTGSDGTGTGIGELVESTGVPHRRVIEVLRRLGLEVTGDEAALRQDLLGELRRLLGCEEPPAPDDPDRLEGAIAEVAAGLPASVWALDHVPATLATIVARARYLSSRYDLREAHLVCLGDHDLTGVATGLLVPEVTVSVVDVDERLLEYLDSVSDRLGLGLHLYGADLRLGLPRAVRQGADLVFTDPPYSVEGVDLFVRRGVEALSDRPGASLLFCYGTGARGAERQLEVQDRIGRLHLVLDALLPGFNRYHGAHAIGAASALWVVRPSRRTRAAVAAAGSRRIGAADARIYSRGTASRESPAPRLPEEVLAAVGAAAWLDARDLIEAAMGGPGGSSSRPKRSGGREAANPPWLVERSEGADHERKNEGKHGVKNEPHLRHPPRLPDAIAVNLDRFYGTSVTRVLMAAPTGSSLAVVGDGRAIAVAGRDPARRLVAARFATAVVVEPKPLGVLVATPVPPDALGDVAWVLRYLQEHHAARLKNAWREGLCALAGRRGGACTKNEARSLIEATPMRAAELEAYLLDLPAHRLGALVGSVEQTVGALEEVTAVRAQ